MSAKEQRVNTGSPQRWEEKPQLQIREEKSRPLRVAERSVGTDGGGHRVGTDLRSRSEEQSAYGPQRSAHDAVRRVHELLNRGYTEVVDADLSSYFDTIPHHELMKSIARRVSDGAMLALIKTWLEMAVEENDGKGNKRTTTANKDSGKGTPQGAPISPLLANLYMRRFLLGWRQGGWDRKLKAHIVNYADDFVILCRATAQKARAAMEAMMGKLKLKVNQQKTRVCRVPEESFDFLGYTLGRCYRAQSGKTYLGTKPSQKRVQRICEKISQMTQRKWCWKEPEVKGNGRTRFKDEYLYQQLGLFRLERFSTTMPWAKA
jgi:RNA-directed DNA polymerase